MLRALATFAVAVAWAVAHPAHSICAPGPPEGMDALQAYLAGVDLARLGQSSESLPYLHRALALRPDLWQVHCDYGAALINSVSEARPGRGGTRRRAERLASNSLDSAHVIAIRAHALAIWGLSWNGLAEYVRAQRLDSVSAELRGRKERLRRTMRIP
ncbi:MAG: hypothetical protein E6K72_03545 [Candidatus Eisenbacteria bacterium]|uniref:Tetratricopeptide repeat protein n=1 Tax=Eiseniibacteriota bacterium TaxID=2212470 RepID=A0A538T1W2_UNCEI|nr:MAG: hypothetical protein E6K72_03545 [Candidatus Eisenbacteria bacterium]